MEKKRTMGGSVTKVKPQKQTSAEAAEQICKVCVTSQSLSSALPLVEGLGLGGGKNNRVKALAATF